tara:strand:- start:846 stop:1190 length:345 start_codon:yes stop_codon:yes gene_type:complete
MKKLTLLAVLALVTVTSCKKEETQKLDTYKVEVVAEQDLPISVYVGFNKLAGKITDRVAAVNHNGDMTIHFKIACPITDKKVKLMIYKNKSLRRYVSYKTSDESLTGVEYFIGE